MECSTVRSNKPLPEQKKPIVSDNTKYLIEVFIIVSINNKYT